MLWISFNIFVIAMLLLDLYVFHRRQHEIGIVEALVWSGVWTILAFIFNGWVYVKWGHEIALQFFAGYLIERSLSFDNLFVFLMIFTYFGVSGVYQHRVLFWGIVGALVMRAGFIFAGVAIIRTFHWVLYIFGALLIYTGVRMFYEKDKEVHPEKNILIRCFRRLMPVTKEFKEGKFFCRENGKLCATPLFVVLIAIETTDVIFAVDSIPAIFAVTLDPFIIYTSNIFAILGLRALYFALAALMRMFRYLNYGLGVILAFVGFKMIVATWYEIPIAVTLGVVAFVLTASIVVSIIRPQTGCRGSDSGL